MKTLDEIINRQDYVRMNNALYQRARQLGDIALKKMVALECKSLSVNGHKYMLVNTNFYYNGEFCNSVKEFCLYSYDEERSEFYWTLGLQDDRCSPDKGSWARSCDNLTFLNDAKDLFRMLDELESRKVADIENAINLVSNI